MPLTTADGFPEEDPAEALSLWKLFLALKMMRTADL